MGRRDAIRELLIQVADEEQEQTQNADMVFLVSAVELTNPKTSLKDLFGRLGPLLVVHCGWRRWIARHLNLKVVMQVKDDVLAIINGITLQTRVDDALTALLIVMENQQEIDWEGDRIFLVTWSKSHLGTITCHWKLFFF